MKQSKKGYLLLAIGFLSFHLIAFLIPGKKLAVFWIAYGFSAVAFLLQAAIWKRAADHDGELISKYLKVPLIQVGIVYLLVQAAVFLVFKFLPQSPVWLAALICALILCVTLVCLITADAATEAGMQEVERIDSHIRTKRQYLKNLQIDVEMLAEAEQDAEFRDRLFALAKKIRLSDPMSDDALQGLENQIAEKIAELKAAEPNKGNVISEVELLLAERNKKVKALKG